MYRKMAERKKRPIANVLLGNGLRKTCHLWGVLFYVLQTLSLAQTLTTGFKPASGRELGQLASDSETRKVGKTTPIRVSDFPLGT